MTEEQKSVSVDNAAESEPAASTAPRSTPLETVLTSPWLHMALLVGLVLVCFGRTTTSDFLADDWGEIGYISTIFNGRWDLFWSNFTGNFMQIQGMAVYRPMLLVSLAADYLLYGSKAWGYYVSNLLYFSGCVVLTYLIARSLSQRWGSWRSSLSALLAAALFAANPLRCESVSWVVGRVDIVCCFFFLLSMFFFLRGGSRATRILSVASFWLALMTKEMAVGLPVVLTAGLLFGCFGERNTARRKIVSIVKESAPYWICLALYFVLRQVFLGTLAGGYVAGFGASQLSHIVEKWTDPDTLHRLFYPCNFYVAPEPNIYARALFWCYCGIGSLALMRLLTRQVPWRLLSLYAVWIAVSALPIFQLWGLGYNLEGSRFYFFLSVPLMLSLCA
ncbi:MAG: hypothetical protein ACRD3W_21100, partial [Terriglobales bacterium]